MVVRKNIPRGVKKLSHGYPHSVIFAVTVNVADIFLESMFAFLWTRMDMAVKLIYE